MYVCMYMYTCMYVIEGTQIKRDLRHIATKCNVWTLYLDSSILEAAGEVV